MSAASGSTRALRVENAGVARGGTRILHGIDLTLHPGEMCALIGPSGAGKSSLIRILLGLWEPDGGRVALGGRQVDEVGALGYVPQDDALHRGLSVRKELTYAAELRMPGASEEERRVRVEDVIAKVGLTDRADAKIRRLSGGQRKRVAVALELITQPPLLILDEPTSGLDPGLEAKTMSLLADVAAAGRIVPRRHARHGQPRQGSCLVCAGARARRVLRTATTRARVLPGRSVRGALPSVGEAGAACVDDHAEGRPRAAHVPDAAGCGAGSGCGAGLGPWASGRERSPMSDPRSPTRVLAARYRDTLLGDPGGTFLLLAQAPLIGYLCAVVWGSIESDTPALYFVLCLAAIWFGCINACREIVKERAILERERLFGVRAVDYVRSKVIVLAGVGAIQVVLLQGTLEWHLQLRGPMGVELLALFGASLAGTGLGLVVSALATTQERAVFAVPLLLLPQILFSELAIPDTLYSDVVAAAEKAMPVHWAFRVFEESTAVEPSWFSVALSLAVLFAIGTALVALATLAVLPRREVVT